jgi:hypothetical protein
MLELKTLMGNCARPESSVDSIRELQIPVAARLQYLKSQQLIKEIKTHARLHVLEFNCGSARVQDLTSSTRISTDVGAKRSVV